MLKRAFLFIMLAPVAMGAREQTSPRACEPPIPAEVSRNVNIFTEAQEVDLGDAIAEQVQSNFRVIDNDTITGYLRGIGDRLVRHLPPNHLQFRFFLVDLPDANAFVLPGGRIYVSRKLVSFARTEDELAGVMAHEIGHLVARQQTIAISRQMKEALGVTEVGDRQDIFDKYHRLIESEERKPGAFRSSADHDGQDQIAADRIGLFAVAGAGYDPSAMANLWDRFAGAKGKTGGFLSDLLGTTTPESKRLREMIKTLSSLPRECVDARASDATEEFRAWQAAVLTYTGVGRKESLHGVVSQTPLDPPLRGEITHLRFSPDGTRLLAQDESGITVLSREPFTPLFRINAADASRAQFTPDSRGIVFHNRDMRVEHWSALDGSLREAHELVIRVLCAQTALAPDGARLACLDDNFTLNVFDVATNATLFQKKNFIMPGRLTLLRLLEAAGITGGIETENAALIDMEFSPDGRFFIASERNATPIANVGAFDAQTGASVSLPGSIQKLISGGFIFTGPDRFMALNIEEPAKSALITLPAATIVSRVPFMAGSSTTPIEASSGPATILIQPAILPSRLARVTSGNYALVRSATGQYPVSLMSLDRGATARVSELPALDVYENMLVSERLNGELGLYALDTNELKSVAQLPGAIFASLRSVAVSPDFEWIAVSEATRGSVWAIDSGKRIVLVRGFRDGAITGDDAFTAEFPKFRQTERQFARIDLNAPDAGIFREEADTSVRTYGDLRLAIRPARKGGRFDSNVTFEMQDGRTGKPLWTRSFPNEVPDVWVDLPHQTMILVWGVLTKAAQSEIKAAPALAERSKVVKDRNDDLVEVLDLRTGETRGSLLVETGKGSFQIDV
ncbi:MAG TPA: M48 family metalloprotease, partial [Terriglobia bacterium]|nr:M48 family metalloprotease [Terriglobia bacterium]